MLQQTLYGFLVKDFFVIQYIKRVNIIWRIIQIMDAKMFYGYKLSYAKFQVLAALLIFQETQYKTQGMKFYAKSLKRGNLIFAQRKIHFYDSVSTREQNKILVTMNNLCLSIFA